MAGFDFCGDHVRVLVARGHASLEEPASGYLGRVADKFVMAMVGALGTAVVTHWDEIILAIQSITLLLPDQFREMFPPAPRTGGPSSYSDDEILHLSINGHPRIVVIKTLDGATEFDYEPLVGQHESALDLLEPYTAPDWSHLTEDLDDLWDADPGEIKRAALHEAGHAAVAFVLSKNQERPALIHVCIHPGQRDPHGHVIGCTSTMLQDLGLLERLSVIAAGLYGQSDRQWSKDEWLISWRMEEADTTYLDDLYEMEDLLSSQGERERNNTLCRVLDVLDAIPSIHVKISAIADALVAREILSVAEVAKIVSSVGST